MKTRIGKAVGVLGLCIFLITFMTILAPARGEAQILAVGTNTNPVVFSDALIHTLPINGGATGMGFVTTVPNQRVVVLFTAECSVKGLDNVTQVNLDILIDGVIAAPSMSDDAFCTDKGNNLLLNWASHAINVVRIIPTPGVHSVVVRARLLGFNPGDAFRIDDSTTIVMK